MEIVKLYPFFNEYKVKVGQQLKYSFRAGGSSGFTADAYLEKEDVLMLKNKNSESRKISTESSEEESIITITFEAIAKGETTIIITEYERMVLSGTYELKVFVE